MSLISSSLEQAFLQHFETLGNDLPFYPARQQAMEVFGQQGLPTLKNEAYKYTPVAQLLAAQLDRVQPEVPTESLTEPTLHALEGYPIRLHNGQLSTSPAIGDQVQVFTFQEAYQQQHPAFLAHFAKHAQSSQDALIALNTALFEEGLFVYIPDRVVLDKPLVIDHGTTDTSLPITYPRLLIVAGQHSQAHVITSWQGSGFTNTVAEVVVEESARLDYYILQTALESSASQIHTTQCYQAASSVFNAYTFTWSGALVRNNLYSMLGASHTETNMYGLYCLRGEQHVDNFTIVDHRQPHAYSNELYKGIIMDQSTGVFNGRIYVQPAAQKTNAFQQNNNLLLSDGATLHTKPQLEIWADDVKCSHGATTGQLDAEQLFYLRARGIPHDTAQALLRQAFVSEVIDKVPLESLRMQLQASWAAQESK